MSTLLTWKKDYNNGSQVRKEVNKYVIAALEKYYLHEHQTSLKVFKEAVDIFLLSEKIGLKKYGPDFAGDPLNHALQEARDLCLYLATELQITKLLLKEGRIYGIPGVDRVLTTQEDLNTALQLFIRLFNRVTGEPIEKVEQESYEEYKKIVERDRKFLARGLDL